LGLPGRNHFLAYGQELLASLRMKPFFIEKLDASIVCSTVPSRWFPRLPVEKVVRGLSTFWATIRINCVPCFFCFRTVCDHQLSCYFRRLTSLLVPAARLEIASQSIGRREPTARESREAFTVFA
jgi:hypothetical protein